MQKVLGRIQAQVLRSRATNALANVVRHEATSSRTAAKPAATSKGKRILQDAQLPLTKIVFVRRIPGETGAIQHKERTDRG